MTAAMQQSDQDQVRVIIADSGARWFAQLAPSQTSSEAVVLARVPDEPLHVFIERVVRRIVSLTLKAVVDVAYVDEGGDASCRDAILRTLRERHGIEPRLSGAAVAA